MKPDKGTLLIGIGTVLVAIVVATKGGPVFAVVGTVTAGLASAAFWQLWQDRRTDADRRRVQSALAASHAIPAPVGDGGVVRFLRPEEEVVDFWPRPELGQLINWVASERHIAVQLLTGPGGTGKTRLARKLASDVEPVGFNIWWPTAGAAMDATSAALDSGKSALLVLDYAETCDDLRDILSKVFARRDGPPIRILLLARSAGVWWQQLITSSRYEVSEALAASKPIVLDALTDETGQQQVFRQALVAFAGRLDVACPDVKLSFAEQHTPVLVVHATALLAVLTNGGDLKTTEVAHTSADVLAGLLRHEARYWQQSQTARGLDLDPEIARCAVAVGCLVGADDEAAAVRLLARIPDLADAAALGKAARWLHDLYPLSALTPDRPEWLGALQPDRLGEQLAVDVLRDHFGLIPELFHGLAPRRATRALTTLARTALADETAVPLIATAISSDLEDLAEPAMAVALTTNLAVGDLLDEALKSSMPTVSVLERIAGSPLFLPEQLSDLCVTVCTPLTKLADVDPIRRGSYLVGLSMSLSRFGWRRLGYSRSALDTQQLNQALAAIGEAVTLYRDLDAARPGEFRAELAASLAFQATCLASLDQGEQALAAIDEAVGIYWELATAHPDVFRSVLTVVLASQAYRLNDIGRREEAKAVGGELKAIMRELADKEVDFPHSLHIRAVLQASWWD